MIEYSSFLLLPCLLYSKKLLNSSLNNSNLNSSLNTILIIASAHLISFTAKLLGFNLPFTTALNPFAVDEWLHHTMVIPSMQICLLVAYHKISKVYPQFDLLSHTFIAIHLLRSIILFWTRNNNNFIDWNNWTGSRNMHLNYKSSFLNPSSPLALLYSAWPTIWIGMQLAGRLLQEHMSGVSPLMQSNALRNIAVLIMLAESASIACVLNGEFEHGGIGMPDWLEVLLERARECTYVLVAGFASKLLTDAQPIERSNDARYDVRHAMFPYSMLPSQWRSALLKTEAPPVSGLSTLVSTPAPTTLNRGQRRQQERKEALKKK